mmetsp:Transcript_25853/g.81664  ORF Transcript_25853/g.81664 Transcript_25853/m.81664 type:complete len:201 (-) Transcript_25853:334-936(-)
MVLGSCCRMRTPRSGTSPVFMMSSQKLRCSCRSSPSVFRRKRPASAIHSMGKGSSVLLMKRSSKEAKCAVTLSPYGRNLKYFGMLIGVTMTSIATISANVSKANSSSLSQRGVSMFSQLMSSGCGAGSYSKVTEVKGTWPNLRLLNQHIQRPQSHHFGALPRNFSQSSGFLKSTKAEPHMCIFRSLIFSSFASRLRTRLA